MHALAWIWLGTVGLQLLPGSVYKVRPKIDWGGPHVYFNLAGFAVVLALVVKVLV